jgi:hypothetical protein
LQALFAAVHSHRNRPDAALIRERLVEWALCHHRIQFQSTLRFHQPPDALSVLLLPLCLPPDLSVVLSLRLRSPSGALAALLLPFLRLRPPSGALAALLPPLCLPPGMSVVLFLRLRPPSGALAALSLPLCLPPGMSAVLFLRLRPPSGALAALSLPLCLPPGMSAALFLRLRPPSGSLAALLLPLFLPRMSATVCFCFLSCFIFSTASCSNHLRFAMCFFLVTSVADREQSDEMAGVDEEEIMPSMNVGGPSSEYTTQFFSKPVVQATPSLTVDSLLQMLSNNGQGVIISRVTI